MFSPSTIQVIGRIVECDSAATDADKRLVLDAVKRTQKSAVVRIRANEVCRILGVCRATLWHRIHNGEWKFNTIRDGRRSVFYIRDEIEAFARRA